MDKNRLEAFSDGVLAIIITIMVLELKQPVGDKWGDLGELSPILLSYALSFLFVAIYWVNHHIIFHQVERVNYPILWCNIAWLFSMSFKSCRVTLMRCLREVMCNWLWGLTASMKTSCRAVLPEFSSA